jgi:uncharacterized membrane protein
MSPEATFDIHLVLGYVAWLLFFGPYLWPRLKAMNLVDAQRAIAVLHSFRFFGLAFVLPGVVGSALPQAFAIYAAWGDLATGLLAMAALMTFRVRPLFWFFVAAFNVVGFVDLVIDYYHGTTLQLGALSGQLGSLYIVPIIYVPILMITHWAALILLMRSARATDDAESRAGVRAFEAEARS